MNRFWKGLALAYLVATPPRLAYVLYRDFQLTPEEWNADPLHDPRLYLPMWGLVVVLAVVVGLRIWWVERVRSEAHRCLKS